MAKHEASVDELVGMIQRGELRLPEMQRRYVWKGPRVRDLFDSLYRGYPSGTILVWETEEAVPLQNFSIAQNTNPFYSTRLLLDGQQRLTSLSAVMRGEPIEVRGKKKPIELLFNLEHPDELAPSIDGNDEEDDDDRLPDEIEASDDELQRRFDSMAFVVGTKKLARLPHWVRVSEVFKSHDNGEFLERAGVTLVQDPRAKKYGARLERLRSIRHYMYRMDILERGLSYAEVTEVFVRVNSLGAKLRSSDLALAQITAKWRHSLATFQAFQNQCAEDGFGFDLGIFIKALITFATGQSRFRTVGSLTLEKLQEAWLESTRGMEFAINFLKNNAGVDGPALLTSPFLLIAVAFYGRQKKYELTPEESARLRFWALVANAKGRYSRGSSESLLDQDLASIARDEGVEALVDRLRLQVGRLDVSTAELEGKNQRSSLFKTMFLAFKQAGATDWRSNLAISLDNSGKQHKLQFHHIFPKALLKKDFSDKDAEDIANLAFIGGQTNQRISAKQPREYLTAFVEKIGTEPFAKQGIPVDPALLGIDEFKAFLTERRKNIAHILNRFLGHDEPTDEGTTGTSLSGTINAGEGVACEFKSTLRTNLQTGERDPRMERAVLKTIAGFLNSDGGSLIIGVDDSGTPLGLERDAFLSEDKMNLHLANLIRDQLGAQHMAFIRPAFDDHKGSRVLVVSCKKGRGPTYLKEGQMEHFYIRSGAATVELTGNKMQDYIKHRF